MTGRDDRTRDERTRDDRTTESDGATARQETTSGGSSRPIAGPSGGHGLVGVPDAGAFLARLIRLDPTALVRLRSIGHGRVSLWARLPWSVLVTRTVAGPGPGDATVAAAELLTELDHKGVRLPARRDAGWRWPLPPTGGRTVEMVPASQLRKLAAAAAGTLRSATSGGAGGRAVGQRVLRDALLDHVAVVVTGSASAAGSDRVEVSQRLVQAVVRMGFLGTETPADMSGLPGAGSVQVRTAGQWVGLAAPFGAAWLLKVNQLTIMTGRHHPNG